MSVFVKICGLTTPEAVEAAVSGGANAIGFVFAESPRRVSVGQACELTRLVPPAIVRVAVMRHPSRKEWAEVAQGFQPDWVQTDAEDFAGLEIGAKVRRLPVYRDEPTLDTRVIANEERILFESPTSGEGRQADWNRAGTLATKTELVLAGGLNSRNVEAAIRQVQPWGVDVSSGVERSRGEKDPEQIAAFIRAVRKLECSDAG